MNNLLLKYEQLAKRYNIKNNSDYKKTIVLIRKYIEEAVRKHKKIAIWGGGMHTEVLLSTFGVELKNLVCIIDNSFKNKRLEGIEIIDPSQIHKKNIDCIIISSYNFRNEIKNIILKQYKDIDCLDIYEKLEEEGIKLATPFYFNSNIYIDINNLKEKYSKEKDFYKKSYYLKSIIENYIRIKDFLYAIKYIEKYIEEELENHNLMKNLKEDLTELILEIKNKLKFYKDRNILLLYIDSLRSVDLMKFNRMKFLREFAKENTYYSKAYSTSIYTYESFMPTLKEEDVLMNKNYDLISINENECKCVKKAINQGFSFNLCSASSSCFIKGDNINVKNAGQYISETLWQYVINLSSDSISLLYILAEVHLPHIGGEHKGRDIKVIRGLFSEIDGEPIDENMYITQYEESLKYVDEQLKFYLNMLNNDADIFIFSDHGQIIEGIGEGLEKLETKLGWHGDRINIPLIVKSKYFKKGVNKDVVSLMDFNNIVCSLIDKKSFLPNREYAKVALSPIHNKNMRYNFEKYNKSEYLNGFEVFIFQDFKIVVTSDETIKGYHIENFNEHEEYNKDILRKYYEYVEDDILVTKSF